MAIAGSMDQWRGRLKMATDAELAILDQDSDPDSELRPILSDEILRRSTSQGQDLAQAPIAVPAAPDVPVTIPTAPAALMSVPDAPPPPGGRGAPPADPVTLASRAQRAIEGGDQDTAIKLYDFGLETHGQAFVSAFDALDREAPKGGLPRTEGGRGGVLGYGGLPRSAAGRDDQEINPPGLPAVPPPGSVPVPDQPVATPLSKDGPLPMVRPDPLIKVGDAAGLPPDRTDTGYRMTLNGLPRAGGDKGGALGYGGLPRSAAGRDDQEINPPGVPSAPPGPYPAPVANLDRALEDVSQSSIAPIAPGPVDRTVTSEALPAPAGAGLRSVSSDQAPLGRLTRGPMTTAAGTAYGQQRLDDPNVATSGLVELPEDTVTIVKETGRPARSVGGSNRNLPRGGTKLAADPGSGGLASAVTVPMRPEPQPAVDTGTNTSPAAKPTSTVDTGTNTPAVDDSGFMSKPDIWSFLTSAGLGMMSSQSPDFLGAVGAGGTAGINQLGTLRKDQRERQKNLADAQFQKDRIALGYAGEAGQDRRAADQNRTTLEVTRQNNAGANQRSTEQNQTTLENTRLGNQGAMDRVDRQGQVNLMLEQERDRLTREGKVIDRDELFKWGVEHGGSEDEVRRAMLGITEKSPDKVTPMTNEEVAQALDLAAGNFAGAGVTGQQLMALLPIDVAQEIYTELGKHGNSGTAAGVVIGVLRKHGITYEDGYFSSPKIVRPTRPPGAAPAAASGAAGSGNARYVPGQGIVR